MNKISEKNTVSKECCLVKDLYPLVIEGIATKESREFVEDHIGTCSACQALYRFEEEKTGQDEQIKDGGFTKEPGLVVKEESQGLLETIHRKMKHIKRIDILFVLFLVLAALATIFLLLGRSNRLLHEEEAIEHIEMVDKGLLITLKEGVYSADYEIIYGEAEADGCNRQDSSAIKAYTIWATASKLDEFFSTRRPQKTLLIVGYEESTPVYFQDYSIVDRHWEPISANDKLLKDAKKVEQKKIYGPPQAEIEDASFGFAVLPRLALAYYATLALVLTIIFAVCSFLTRKQPLTKVFRYGACLSLAFVMANLLTGTVTFKIVRVFIKQILYAFLLGSFLYFAIEKLSVKRKYKEDTTSVA